MATWIMHMRVADRAAEKYPMLDRRAFCVGNIAPDCNVENETWDSFTPPRQVTHWMSAERKTVSDGDVFLTEYVLARRDRIRSREEYSFLLGYYSHLLTDGAYQLFIRNRERVDAVWRRIRADENLSRRAEGFDETWNSVKKIFSREEREAEIDCFDAEYLASNPGSSYLTVILPLREFPDYMDYLPENCIVRKIGVMGYLPSASPDVSPVVVTRDEYGRFADSTVGLIAAKFESYGLCRGESLLKIPADVL